MLINVASALALTTYCAFRPNSVFKCFVGLSQKTPITSLNIIKVIGCVKEKECICFVVETQFLNNI